MARPDSKRSYRVVAELSAWQGYYRPILKGVLRYAAEAPRWELHSIVHEQHGLGLVRPPETVEPMDGRIVPALNERLRAILADHPHPVVTIRDRFEADGTPTVTVDNDGVGVMAANYLLDLGFRHFATVGAAGNQASQSRLAGFHRRVDEAGGRVEGMPESAALGDPNSPVVAAEWLRGLPTPAGVFCWTDETAHNTVHAIKAAGLTVPDDLAVVGVHNDAMICETTRPTLTSVALPLEQIGYEAAALLDRLMHGHPPPDAPVRLPPIEVVERQSTGTLPIDDPAVRQAMAIINRQAVHGLTAEALCEAMDPPISRRTLERRFAEALGHSPHQHIRRVQCQRAREMLVNTDLPQDQIALRCGFSSNPFFSNTFRKVTGQRPGQYRKQRRRR